MAAIRKIVVVAGVIGSATALVVYWTSRSIDRAVRSAWRA